MVPDMGGTVVVVNPHSAGGKTEKRWPQLREIIHEAYGPFGSVSDFEIAFRARSWRWRSIVVFTFNPPPKTVDEPPLQLSISCCFT